jgi:hypothetical protein
LIGSVGTHAFEAGAAGRAAFAHIRKSVACLLLLLCSEAKIVFESMAATSKACSDVLSEEMDHGLNLLRKP